MTLTTSLPGRFDGYILNHESHANVLVFGGFQLRFLLRRPPRIDFYEKLAEAESG